MRFRRRRRETDRSGTAAAIRNLISAAEEPDSWWRDRGIEPPLRAPAVLAAQDDLLAIALLLEGDADLPEQTVACASWLAWSDGSPVCSDPADDADVAHIAARLRASLEGAATTGARRAGAAGSSVPART